MCGICGMVRRSERLAPQSVEDMTAAMRHRGPDDVGLYVSPDTDAALGNCRLAIIDLSSAGHMPMSSADGRVWITYNGELYNFKELRSELEARGHTFRSHTDTEVVLALFLEYGEDSVRRLNGMFAFAIWDEQEHSLFLARDRFGIKPLYYHDSPRGFLWASEVQALIASGCIERHVDPSALTGYFMLGSVPDDRTVIRGVESLPPASYATLRDGRLRVTQYWSHAAELRNAPVLADDEIPEAVDAALTDAVRRQVVSDAPLGLFLSGGADSSMLAALTRKVGIVGARAVAIRFSEETFDEGEEAKRVAERYELDYREYQITAWDVESELDRVVASMDQPTIDAVNTYFVSKAARDAGLTVALSGLGADELFGGYTSFSRAQIVRRVMGAAARIPGHHSILPRLATLPGLPYRVRRSAAWASRDPSFESAYLAIRGLFAPGELHTLMPGLNGFDPHDYVTDIARTEGLSPGPAMSLLETRFYMHNQLLRDTDAMSMAHSLEVRVPYLDNVVAAVAAGAQAWLDRPDKPALRAARAPYFPDEVDRPKRGFSFPFPLWLKSPEAFASSAAGAAAVMPTTAGWERVRRDFEGGRRDWSHVWAPLLLSRWLEAHRVTV